PPHESRISNSPMHNTPAPATRLVAPILLLSLLFAGEFIAGYHRIEHGKRGDFLHFWYASRAVAHREDPYTAWEGGYIYPPLIAFLYRPLAAMPEVPAIRLMLAINLTLAVFGTMLAADVFVDRLGAP